MEAKLFKIRKFNGEFVTLSLEIPKTDKEYYNGLGFRDEIPENTGMLYDYSDSLRETASMFTPDTKVPVDFIFVDKCGVILEIHHMAKPLSNKIINCCSTSYVIEIAGGESKKLGIKEGDVLILDKELENDIFAKPESLHGIFYKKTGDYFCKNDSGIYLYSYRAHRWVGPIEEKDEWRMFERHLALEPIDREEIIPKEIGLNECVKRDFDLIKSYSRYKKYYYKMSNNLFIAYEPKNGEFEYYSYKKGWTKFGVCYFERVRVIDNIRWESMVQLKSEVEKQIKENRNKFSKKELNLIDNKNWEKIDELILKAYPSCRVFYKEDYEPGWKMAYLPGRKVFVEEQCKKFKVQKNWKEYLVYWDVITTYPTRLDWNPKIAPYCMRSHNNWFYNHENNKLFILPDEELPIPSKKAEYNNAIKFEINFDDIENGANDELSLDMTIKVGKNVWEVPYLEYERFKKRLSEFIFQINSDKKFVNFLIDDFYHTEFFIWEINKEKIRFLIQDWTDDYCGDDICEVPIDIEINKNIFIEFLNKMQSELIEKAEKCIKEYKNKK